MIPKRDREGLFLRSGSVEYSIIEDIDRGQSQSNATYLVVEDWSLSLTEYHKSLKHHWLVQLSLLRTQHSLPRPKQHRFPSISTMFNPNVCSFTYEIWLLLFIVVLFAFFYRREKKARVRRRRWNTHRARRTEKCSIRSANGRRAVLPACATLSRSLALTVAHRNLPVPSLLVNRPFEIV